MSTEKNKVHRNDKKDQRPLKEEQGRKDGRAGRSPMSPSDKDYMAAYDRALAKRAKELGGA